MSALARVRLASVPEERFAAEIRALVETIDQLPAEAVRAVLAELDATRRQVLAELLTAQGYPAARLTQLDANLRDLMARFAERYDAILSPVQATLFQAGQALAAQPLVSAGLMFHVPQLSRRLFEVAQGYQASLITGLADAAVGDISSALRVGVLRGQSVLETAQQVAGSLTGPSTFGSIATRAETITRTELGRMQAIGTQAGMEETRRFVPDLKKQWRHSGNTGRWARLGHIEAEDQIRDVADRFHVRPAPGLPYEDLAYPRDPGASAKNSINCGCLSVPYREAWAAALKDAA